MERRKFLKNAGKLAGSVALTASALSANTASLPEQVKVAPGELPRRKLVRTGEALSIIGFPGMVMRHYEQKECNDAMVKARDMGINYFDVAPAYGKDGECEIKMGKGMRSIDRDKIFLSCKTKMRDSKGARMELERSLKRLQTDHFDLYQMHVLHTPGEVEQAFGPGGCMDVIEKAKKEGKIRRIGFSAHTSLAAMAAMNNYQFDTVMFPINFVEHFSFAFGQAVLEKAHSQKVSVLTIKSTSAGAWDDSIPREERDYWYRVLEDQDNLKLAVHFALSQPNVVSSIPAAHYIDHLEKTVAAA
ncbi:aldo/keto reductase, partial [Pontiella sp.]|uniref:aldo/keto reductase n=1 Tax=Pontiella sp. TaxID=2837462 RepID=UPI00356733E2